MSAKKRWLWRSTSKLLVLMMAFSLLLPASTGAAGTDAAISAQPAASIEPAAPVIQSPSPKLQDGNVSEEEALQKIHPDLRELAQTAGPILPQDVGAQAAIATEPVLIRVMVRADDGASMDVSSYFVDGKVIARPILGNQQYATQSFYGQVYPYIIKKLASIAQVEAILPVVMEKNGQPDDLPIDDPRPEPPARGPADWAALRERAESLRAGTLPWDKAEALAAERAESLSPTDWFEVHPMGPHKAEVAWARGFTGEGVTVAVNDDGVDFAHPDLIGTQKIYNSSAAPQYNGYPMVFSPFSLLAYALEDLAGQPYISGGYPAVHFVDTSTTPELTPCGSDTSCFVYTPLIDFLEPGLTHTYYISSTMTQSGVVHVGTHPDRDLRDYVWGELPAVLVTDPNTAGVYDTVYVDLNNDYSFKDEKPMTRADVTNETTLEATKNNPVSYRDLDGDGLNDLSGGMLYFIADGENVIPASDYTWGADCSMGIMCPGNGDLIALEGSTFDRPYSHGTQCASNIVGQGVVNALLPAFNDLDPGTPGAETPAGAVYGMAPDAKVVAVADVYYDFENSKIDAYTFAAFGYDGIESTDPTDTDAIQVTSNSYGSSDQDNDGWEFDGQFVSQIIRKFAPQTQFMFSTGNGAPAYGTSAPPAPNVGIAVGASTEYGSTGWDTITNTFQIMNNDITPFSNRGPAARGNNGVDVVAGGAYAAGDEELNYYAISTWGVIDGNYSWVSWGGTSRSAPVATGIMALLYDAYEEANGDFPRYDVSKAILQSSATDLNYDTFSQGAGSVNGDTATALAAGLNGAYILPTEWNPGDYRGDVFPGFAQITYPGDEFTQVFTVTNPTGETLEATLSDSSPVRIGTSTFDYMITPDMFATKPADNFYKAPQWIIPITAEDDKIAQNSWWDNIPIPDGTSLMIVRMRLPFDEFDVDGDYLEDNRFRLMVYNWLDVNEDGDVWNDANGNGQVDFTTLPEITTIDGGSELDWANAEVDRWEYGRFGYSRPGGNIYELWVHDPEERMLDGLFIGLQQYDFSVVEETHMSFQVDFYANQDVEWLTLSDAAITLDPGTTSTFQATVNVPSDMPTGAHQAAIKVHIPELDTGDEILSEYNTVVPVVLNVAAEFDPAGTTVAGQEAYEYDLERPYNNGAVRGLFDWTWRAESGDWRFYFVDIPDAQPTEPVILAQTTWDGPAPVTDIDTLLLGPVPTQLGTDVYGLSEPEPDYFGPYNLETLGGSPNMLASAGVWRFQTSSGGAEDWVTAPMQNGLHEVLHHSVLFEGDQFWVPFTTTLGTLQVDPGSLSVDTYEDQGTLGVITVTSSLPLNDVVASGYLVGLDETLFEDEPIGYTGEGTIEWTHMFSVADGTFIEASTGNTSLSDVDLYLFYWNGASWAQIASSAGADANENIFLANPLDGDYMIGIDNYSGPAGTLDVELIVGSRQGGVTISGLPGGEVAPGEIVTLTVNYDFPFDPFNTYPGEVVVGIPEAPNLYSVPLSITRLDLIDKNVDKEVAFQGDTLNYTIDIYNILDETAQVTVTDTLPAGVEFVNVNGATYDPGTNTVQFSDMVPLSDGDSPSYTIDLEVTINDDVEAGTTITNTADIEMDVAGEISTSSSSAGTRIGASNLTTSYKMADSTVQPGGYIYYDIHLINTGEAAAENISLIDPLPAGTTYVSHVNTPPYQGFVYNQADNQLEWTGHLAPGQELVFEFFLQADEDLAEGNVISNTATASWDDMTIELSDSTTVGQPALALEKSGAAYGVPGDEYEYMLTYTNTSAMTMTNLTLIDWLPGGVSTDGDTEWTIDILLPGQSGTQLLPVTLDPGLGCEDALTNIANISDETGERTTAVLETMTTCAPVASFEVSDTTPQINETVYFTSTSVGAQPLSYLWDFGDGITGTMETESHAWDQTGTYTVTLTVTNEFGSDTATQVIRVGSSQYGTTIYFPLIHRDYVKP